MNIDRTDAGILILIFILGIIAGVAGSYKYFKKGPPAEQEKVQNYEQLPIAAIQIAFAAVIEKLRAEGVLLIIPPGQNFDFSFWKNPEDESKKLPNLKEDLKNAGTEK